MGGRRESQECAKRMGPDQRADADPDATPPPKPAFGFSYKARLLVADVAALLTALIVATAIQIVLPLSNLAVHEHLLLGLASFPAFALGAGLNQLYLARANERGAEEARNVVRTVAVGLGGLVMIAFAVQFKHLSRSWVMMFGLAAVLGLVIERRIARRLFRRLRRQGRMTRPIVIVGTDVNAVGLLGTYQHSPELGYRVIGFVGDDDIGELTGVEVLGSIDDLDYVLAETEATGVVISQSAVDHDRVNAITRRLTDHGYHVALSSNLTDIDLVRVRPQNLDGRTMLYVEPVHREGWRAFAKRSFDVVTATTLMILTLPVLVAAMIAIRIDSRGPVFFRQQRVGRDGQMFTMTKLRTMVPDAEARRAALAAQNEADGPLFKIASDPRVTRIGRVLRKLSIDELPQLVSVIKGDMSMVGPRPALPNEIADWDEALHERLRVMPGLTGLWQVSGRSESDFEQYRRLDLYYVHNWTLSHDLRICARTVGVVLLGRGAA